MPDSWQRHFILSAIASPADWRTPDFAGRTVVLKLKTADFQVLTRHHRLPDPTCRAEVIFRVAMPLISREMNGRAFRLIGIGVTDLCPASLADPPDLFAALTR